ncbi:hypothetical protein V2O64_13045 [Verrucomicrobiaceae bacterium 227]
MTDQLIKTLPKPDLSSLDEETSKAIAAANRAGEKLRARKRALGQKLVIWQDGKVVEISP